ncbi:MAG: hypothetical protein ABH821_01510 [archaeon]
MKEMNHKTIKRKSKNETGYWLKRTPVITSALDLNLIESQCRQIFEEVISKNVNAGTDLFTIHARRNLTAEEIIKMRKLFEPSKNLAKAKENLHNQAFNTAMQTIQSADLDTMIRDIRFHNSHLQKTSYNRTELTIEVLKEIYVTKLLELIGGNSVE